MITKSSHEFQSKETLALQRWRNKLILKAHFDLIEKTSYLYIAGNLCCRTVSDNKEDPFPFARRLDAMDDDVLKFFSWMTMDDIE